MWAYIYQIVTKNSSLATSEFCPGKRFQTIFISPSTDRRLNSSILFLCYIKAMEILIKSGSKLYFLFFSMTVTWIRKNTQLKHITTFKCSSQRLKSDIFHLYFKRYIPFLFLVRYICKYTWICKYICWYWRNNKQEYLRTISEQLPKQADCEPPSLYIKPHFPWRTCSSAPCTTSPYLAWHRNIKERERAYNWIFDFYLYFMLY